MRAAIFLFFLCPLYLFIYLDGITVILYLHLHQDDRILTKYTCASAGSGCLGKVRNLKPSLAIGDFTPPLICNLTIYGRGWGIRFESFES